MSSRPSTCRRALRRALAALALAVGLIVGPAVVTVVPATSVATTSAATEPPVPDPETIGSNPFIPEDANIGDCVSSAPRPECGSDQRGGYHQYLTLIVLALATVFIGWRIARGVRARDRADAAADDQSEKV